MADLPIPAKKFGGKEGNLVDNGDRDYEGNSSNAVGKRSLGIGGSQPSLTHAFPVSEQAFDSKE
jgi:hypothetical protein